MLYRVIGGTRVPGGGGHRGHGKIPQIMDDLGDVLGTSGRSWIRRGSVP